MPMYAEVFLKRSSLVYVIVCNLCMITKEHVYELFFNFFGALFFFVLSWVLVAKFPPKLSRLLFLRSMFSFDDNSELDFRILFALSHMYKGL